MSREDGYESFRGKWRARFERRERGRKELQRLVRACLNPIVTRLVERYGASKVILTGSLATGDFRQGSDVDLVVVGGLKGTDLLAAGAELERLLPPGVGLDLIPWDIARPAIRGHAIEKGEVLYGPSEE